MSIPELIKARWEAIKRGDKALGREIYHLLTSVLGVNPDEINAPKPKVETTAAPAAPEKAVKPRARKK